MSLDKKRSLDFLVACSNFISSYPYLFIWFDLDSTFLGRFPIFFPSYFPLHF